MGFSEVVRGESIGNETDLCFLGGHRCLVGGQLTKRVREFPCVLENIFILFVSITLAAKHWQSILLVLIL